MNRIFGAIGALLIAFLLAFSAATPAIALPPGGASSDTPGTSASVSPRSLTAGSVLKFTVSGFPAGETLYVKIDDGESCSKDAAQGACVYHSQKLTSSGSASGSFVLPKDLATGKHSLRFLASKELFDDKGAFKGIEGYTRKGGTEFTIIAASSSSAGSGSGSGSGSTGTASGGTGTTNGQAAASEQTAAVGSGEVLTIQPDKSQPAASEPSIEVTAEAAPASPTAAAVAAPVTADDGSEFPVIGVIGFILLLGLSSAVVWSGLGRSARA